MTVESAEVVVVLRLMRRRNV